MSHRRQEMANYPYAKNVVLSWWFTNRRPIICGLISGAVWGLLTAATVTPREWLVYDQSAGIVYKYDAAAIPPQAVTAESFFSEYNSTLIQATLMILILAGLAGWATWQLTRIRPRGEEQPPLRAGLDWYLIGLAIGGVIAVELFRTFGLAAWFKGLGPPPAVVITTLVGILLPLYMGLSLFLVWSVRLKSIRAPDWETHYPKPIKKSGLSWFKFFRRKGGDSPNT